MTGLTIVGLVVALVIVALHAYTFWRYKQQKAIESGPVTSAQVTEKEERTDQDGIVFYYVSYAYEAPDPAGGTRTYDARKEVSHNAYWAAPSEGERVEIRYVAADPAQSNLVGNDGRLIWNYVLLGAVDLAVLAFLALLIKSSMSS